MKKEQEKKVLGSVLYAQPLKSFLFGLEKAGLLNVKRSAGDTHVQASTKKGVEILWFVENRNFWGEIENFPPPFIDNYFVFPSYFLLYRKGRRIRRGPTLRKIRSTLLPSIISFANTYSYKKKRKGEEHAEEI